MTTLYEAEIADGLAEIACNEVHALIGKEGKIHKQHRSNEVPFAYSGDVNRLLELQTVLAVYSVMRFSVPRPRALLGHQNFQRILENIRAIMQLYGHNAYESLYISAAGSDSSVMTRIKAEISQALGLVIAQDEGDLRLRIRPSPSVWNSWDVLVRLSPRPLATRTWRDCNMEGALNASVANAMIRLTKPTPQDTFLNIACGSGTIMIERLAYMAAKQVIGCDIRYSALNCAENNIRASSYHDMQLMYSDGTNSPFANNSVDALCADLPFGQLVGSHQENEWLYPAILSEAARVARPSARFVVITHEIRLMENVLALATDWRIKNNHMITLSGLHPRIFVLERTK
ncbi:MAG: methyltransferase domain-containing protein [Anaerolineae bacterium]|nr:methyltransferase domain-containing protein [Anaerolineae bacterium]MDQ7037060.1 methyltransferase domain-containing protein [Anaerolineae bacterium]